MSDYRALLERASEPVRPSPDAFERLARRRERKERNRRLMSAGVAMVIAISGALGVVAIFTRHAEVQPAGHQNAFYALWPEQTRSEAMKAQASVDSGNQRWRLDPGQTALRFAKSLFGPVRSVAQVTTLLDAQDSSLHGFVPPNVRTVVLRPLRPHADRMIVTLQRLVRAGAGGIWSVTKVQGWHFRLDIEPGARRRSGHTVIVPTAGLSSGKAVSAGYAYIGACGRSTSFTRPEISADAIRFRVVTADLTEDCGTGSASASSSSGTRSSSGEVGALSRPTTGYIFVMRTSAEDVDRDPFHSETFCAGLLDPPCKPPVIFDLAAVPVRFLPEAS